MKVTIENNKLRIGTVEPFGWVDNTFKNRIATKWGYGGLYRHSLLIVLWRIFSCYCIFRPYNTFMYRFWLPKVMCKLGLHQKNKYGLNICGEMYRWCFNCHKRIGEKFIPENLDDYHHIINRAFYKK